MELASKNYELFGISGSRKKYYDLEFKLFYNWRKWLEMLTREFCAKKRGDVII